jgi:hypothetical protein
MAIENLKSQFFLALSTFNLIFWLYRKGGGGGGRMAMPSIYDDRVMGKLKQIGYNTLVFGMRF